MLSHLAVLVQVLVRDHRDKPLQGVKVNLVERQLFRQGGESELMSCTESASSQSDGIAVFICTPGDGVRVLLKVRRGSASVTL